MPLAFTSRSHYKIDFLFISIYAQATHFIATRNSGCVRVWLSVHCAYVTFSNTLEWEHKQEWMAMIGKKTIDTSHIESKKTKEKGSEWLCACVELNQVNSHNNYCIGNVNAFIVCSSSHNNGLERQRRCGGKRVKYGKAEEEKWTGIQLNALKCTHICVRGALL